MEQLSYRPNEAAKVMGLSRDLVFRLIGTGELKSFRVGAARVIPASSIQSWMAGKLEEAGAEG